VIAPSGLTEKASSIDGDARNSFQSKPTKMKKEHRMLKRTITTVVLAVFVAVLAMTAAPARADIHVPFRVDDVKMAYTASSGQMLVTPHTGSALWVTTLDTVAGTESDPLGLEIDTKPPVLYEFDFLLDLTFTDVTPTVSGDNKWAASGTMMISSKVDENGAPADEHIVMLADFNATQFVFDDMTTQAAPMGVDKEFRVVGRLNPYTGPDYTEYDHESILIGDDPWEFTGYNYDTDLFETLSVENPEAYTAGELTTVHFKINVDPDVDTLDELFEADRSSPQGDAFGKVIPAPAALILGLLGLSIVGIRMRRHA